MIAEEISSAISSTRNYNFHSHSEFCDGRAPIREMVRAANEAGMEIWGVSPHSPICIDSPCNMKKEDIPSYLDIMREMKDSYEGRMRIYTGLEIDFLSRDFGPHLDYFQRLLLDFRIGSVHFVPTREGVPLDCDGRYERFAGYLRDFYGGDLRYVVEKYFEQVLTMLESGGFEILGHFDKIIGNAVLADSTLEEQGWYAALVDDVIEHSASAGVIVELNTKAIHDKGRFFPAARWWERLITAGLPLAVNSDAHHPDKVNLGRPEAFGLLDRIREDSTR